MEYIFAQNLFVTLTLALLTGALLGVFFFAGLWWTVNQLESSKHVAWLFLLSLLVRSSIVIGGFYYIVGKDWHHLLAGLLGFIIVRLIATRYIQLKQPIRSLDKQSS